MADSVTGEVEEMSRTQERCVAEQMKLDEASLQRLKEAEEQQKASAAKRVLGRYLRPAAT